MFSDAESHMPKAICKSCRAVHLAGSSCHSGGHAKYGVAHVSLLSRVSGTNDYSEVFTLKQTAAYLRISKAHLSNVITGRVLGVPPLRHARAGRRILIKREWADEWLEIAARESLRQW
jgi:hypothetical protein